MARMIIESDVEDLFDKAVGETIHATVAGVYAGAGVVADTVRAALEALPVDSRKSYIKNIEQEPYSVITQTLKDELLASIGISEIEHTEDGANNAVGLFDGYSSVRTNQYPRGIPLPMVARALESGSSVRRKHPFMRSSVAACKDKAESAMASAAQAVLDKELK